MSGKVSTCSAKDRLCESLSAVLDGEATELELRRVLDGIVNDRGLRETSFRYQRTGDTIRGEINQFSDVDLSGRVMAAIGADDKSETFHNKSSRVMCEEGVSASVKRSRWRRYVASGSVAASVVLAVVMSFRSYNEQSNEESLVDSGSTEFLDMLSEPAQVGSSYYGVTGILASYNSQQKENLSSEQVVRIGSVADRAARSRFWVYALQHVEMSAMTTGQGVLPFARLTGVDVE
ncbi:MAG: sigma-E factor negative regulatory protein [Candidatus Endonucleobacter bathymodioli]|uniref:Sigma-E factor negative regulatory protein n=1 Tax=Candidatus Endonucleibacter bathymodioli TaxID=539814 RepID=A0AA90NJH9_9GAMM|nr:sigma-E factor negative regulatory protein [Candidatus Endonucleobacter bathymodioli]